MQVWALVEGLYLLDVRLYGYSNPTGICQDCLSDMTGQRGCCDRFRTTDCAEFQCDSFFFYCLRDLGNDEELGCSYFGNRTSSVNIDDGSINFSQSTVLGLENPLILMGLTDAWNVSASTLYSIIVVG